jgi:hypothetical protein
VIYYSITFALKLMNYVLADIRALSLARSGAHFAGVPRQGVTPLRAVVPKVDLHTQYNY